MLTEMFDEVTVTSAPNGGFIVRKQFSSNRMGNPELLAACGDLTELLNYLKWFYEMAEERRDRAALEGEARAAQRQEMR